MAEIINTNVFDTEKKFVDFAGLDYFWKKTKSYVDGSDITLYEMVSALEGVVGDSSKGLIKDFKDLKAYTESLGDIEGGEGLGGMIDSKIAALDVEDVAVEGQYVSNVAEVDGKVVVTRAALPVYEEVGVAAGLNEAMDARVKVLEVIDHEKLAADASAAAVATVLDGAPEKFDTLKEVAQWIADSESAETAADLVTRVATLESIDHDAYVEADKTVLADSKAYTDGLAGNYEAAGTAASAIAALDLPNTYDAKGAATDAQAAAIAQAKLDAAETLKGYYTKDEVDNLLSTNSSGDRAYAKQYTDELFNSFVFAQNSDIDVLFV